MPLKNLYIFINYKVKLEVKFLKLLILMNYVLPRNVEQGYFVKEIKL